MATLIQADGRALDTAIVASYDDVLTLVARIGMHDEDSLAWLRVRLARLVDENRDGIAYAGVYLSIIALIDHEVEARKEG
jgi:hypothetical protein